MSRFPLPLDNTVLFWLRLSKNLLILCLILAELISSRSYESDAYSGAVISNILWTSKNGLRNRGIRDIRGNITVIH